MTLIADGGREIAVRVEVADTPQARSLGLMYRKELAPDQGMIFFFERDADHRFWMKNTAIPLDMIFISADGHVVGIQHDAEPYSLKPLGVGTPSRVVLEVHAGFAREHGIRPGHRVTYRGITSALRP